MTGSLLLVVPGAFSAEVAADLVQENALKIND
jgi:hypothetical protein